MARRLCDTCYVRERWGCNCPSKSGSSWVFWALVIAAVLLLSGCQLDDGRECVDYDTQTTLVNTYNGKTYTPHLVTTTVCAKYADK
ncbi:hypothetical protein [Streptomyces violascens]|uniref:Lipoprotein n=1 Tax=Streptomyces violascens TaxID=67381 RepID=A0ABQ3QQX0_9ACTN|nr:hypothetical protein [Streptomyces violascens]GGU49212.1 hypothetical protein GCM10010289_82220 [Streptomyces violascens]GHI39648.1 hypothetical protein Sviol_40560 [Streptomyces violascens]